MKRVVVFGATGNLGVRIACHLQEIGYDIIAVGHRKSDNGFFADKGIPYYSVDISSASDFEILPKENIFAVVHFAGMLPASMKGYDANPYISSIVQGTLNVLEWTRKVNADRIVFPQSLFDISYLFGTKVPIPADSQRIAPLDGDHAVYVIAKNAAVDLIEHYYKVHGLKRFIFRLSRVYLYHPNPYTYKDGEKIMVSDRFLIYKAIKGEDIEVWGDPNRILETCSIYDFLQIIEKSLIANCDGGIYNIGSGGTSLQERIEGIVDVFCPKNHKSNLIYFPEKKDCTQFVLDIRKTVFELNYTPNYSWKDYCFKFKEEMQNQPFAKLQGYEKDYYTEI